MTTVFNDPEIGNIEFSYNSFTGRYNACINGVKATRIEKKVLFVSLPQNSYKIYIYGNLFSGIQFSVKEKMFVVTEKCPWYVYVLGVIPFVMSMVLGNLPMLVDAGFYYVGGAIGGGISGLFSALAIVFAAFTRKHIFRLLILLLAIVLTFLACWGIGSAIVSIATNA